MILLIDNYDSFVFNLARYFERLGQPCVVVRNDRIDVAEARAMRPDAVVLSPGPCAPGDAGRSLELVRAMHRETPILGVCLGHQTIAEAMGARITRAGEPMHGRASRVRHDGRGVFQGLPNPLVVGRYHSLIVERQSLPECLEVTATADSGEVMALRHRTLPLVGVQFHPESVLTDCGYALLAGFLRRAGLMPTADPASLQKELDRPRQQPVQRHPAAMTF